MASTLTKTVLATRAGLHFSDRVRQRVGEGIRATLFDADRPPKATELNVAVVRAAAEKLGVGVAALPGGFLKLTHGATTRYSSGSDFSFEPLVPWFMCGDKRMTSTILAELGLPVPQFGSFSIAQYDLALEFFRASSKPVVVKPTRGTSGGVGVTVDVRTPRQFRAAFARALAWRSEVLVETQIAGEHLRATFLDGELLGLVRRIPAHVEGDGARPIRELIAAKNEAWHSSSPENRLFRPIRVDPELRRILHEAAMDLDSVPAAGQRAYLRRVCNGDQGGEIENVPDSERVDHVDIARAAAAAMGPVLCGVDLIVRDPRDPTVNGNVFINEVNTTPALYVANALVEGRPSTYAAESILRYLFRLAG